MKVHINPKLIPKHEMDNMCRELLPRIIEFYENPENVKKYEEWLEKQEQEAQQ